MQRSSQGANGRCDSTIKIRSGGDSNPSSESGGIEIMLGVKNKRNIKGFDNEGIDVFSLMVEFQEIEGNTICRQGFSGNSFSIVREMIPIIQSRSENTHQPQCDLDLIILFSFRLQNTQYRTNSPHHIHTVRVLGQYLQHLHQDGWYFSQCGDLGAKAVQLGFCGQCAKEEEIDDLFEDAIVGQVYDVVASVVEAKTDAHCGNSAVSGHYSIETLV